MINIAALIVIVLFKILFFDINEINTKINNKQKDAILDKSEFNSVVT